MGKKLCREAFVHLFCSTNMLYKTILPALKIRTLPSVMKNRRLELRDTTENGWANRTVRVHFHAFFKFLKESLLLENSTIDGSIWLPTQLSSSDLLQ